MTQILRADRRRREVRRVLRRGPAGLPLADRATIGNMSPEYGATCGFFPVDDETLRYLRLTGRSDERVALVEAYCKENLLWHDPSEPATYSQVVELDLVDRRAVARRPAAAAGPDRAVRREGVVPRGAADASASTTATQSTRRSPSRSPPATRRRTPIPAPRSPEGEQAVEAAPVAVVPSRTAGIECELDGQVVHLDHGAVVIAAITSCTNTSNPSVMVAAGLLAKKAVERGPRPAAVGQVEPRARLEGRHRLLRPGRPDAVPRGARLPHGRLRLHDLHRQLGPAAGAGLEGDRRRRPRRLRRALGQPELRGARASRGEGELPREPAPRRRVRARRYAWTSTS